MAVLTIRQVVGMFFRRMVLSYASLYILALGGSSREIGLINSLRPLAGLIIFPISGHLTDRSGRVRIIVLADVLNALTMFFYALAQDWRWLAACALLQGLMVFSFPPTSAILADSLSPENRGLGIAAMNTVSNAVAMFSPYVAGALLVWLGDERGMRLLYALMGLQYLFTAALVYAKMEETSTPQTQTQGLNPVKVLKEAYLGAPRLLMDLSPTVLALGLVVLMGFISNAVSSPFWVVYVTEEVGLSKLEWGLVLLLESVAKVVLTIPAGILTDRVGRWKVLLAATTIGLVSLPSLIFSKNLYHVLLVRLGAALSGALFVTSSAALMADYIPREMRGRVMAALGRGSLLVGAAGGGTGGPAMGYLFILPVVLASVLGGNLYRLDPRAPWVAVAAASLVQVAVTGLWIRDPEEANV